MELIISIVTMSVVGIFTAIMANVRGRDPIGWFFLGAFFSLLAIILLLVLPPITDHDRSIRDAGLERYDPKRDY